MEKKKISIIGDGNATLYLVLESHHHTNSGFQNTYKNWKLFTPFVQILFGVRDLVLSRNVTATYCREPFKIGNFNASEGYSIINQSLRDYTLFSSERSSLILRFESSWEDWEKIPEKDFAKEKEWILKDAIALLEKHYPGIGSKIEVMDVCTPYRQPG